MKEAIRQHAFALGFDDCRFTTASPPATAAHLENWLNAGKHGTMTWLARNAGKRVEPQQVLPGAKSILSLAISYHQLKPERQQSVAATGKIARYACHADYHDVVAIKLKALADDLNLRSGSPTRSLWYIDTGPVLERDLAQRAGLGFIGKHTNLISRKFGNWFFLAEILTTLELPPDAPEKNRCGSCVRCLTACPTQAIAAPFQLDARLCISYLTIELKGAIPAELRSLIGDRIYGCDDCLAACPWNKFAQTGSLMSAHARPDLAASDLVELLSLDEAGFKAKFHNTPMLRTKRKGLLRNVCVALGNVGTAADLPALEAAAKDSEPLIADHAKWAVEQIKSRELTRHGTLSRSSGE